MSPTLKIGSWVIVDKVSYHFENPARGDIVVFKPPASEAGACGTTTAPAALVKRIVGLPGDTISLSRGHVYINGRLLSEPYLPPATFTGPNPMDAKTGLNSSYRVPAGEYFMMGDNRSVSCDSRYWGPASRNLFVGRVLLHS
jgi:signal peptidase I